MAQSVLGIDAKTLAVVVVIAGAGSTGGSYLHSHISDESEHCDCRSLGFAEQDIRSSLLREINLLIRERESAIRSQMPPELTKRRIRAIERALQTYHPDFEPATYEWSDSSPW